MLWIYVNSLTKDKSLSVMVLYIEGKVKMEKVKNVYQSNNNKKTIKDCLKRLVVALS